MTEPDWPGYIWRSPSGHRVSPTSFVSPLHHVGPSIYHNFLAQSFFLTESRQTEQSTKAFNFGPNISIKWSYWFVFAGLHSAGPERWGGIDHQRRLRVQSRDFRHRRHPELSSQQTRSTGWSTLSSVLHLGFDLVLSQIEYEDFIFPVLNKLQLQSFVFTCWNSSKISQSSHKTI